MVRVVAQRVTQARVSVEGETVGSIGGGLVLLVGIGAGDTEADVVRLAYKIAEMRVFEDSRGNMNLSAAEAAGDMLVVSQFTLYADLRRGRRPSFTRAAAPETAEKLCDVFASCLAERGYRVERGRFGSHMLVDLSNDGPVTIILDSSEFS